MRLKPTLVVGVFVANLLLILFMWWQNSSGLVVAGNYALALGRLTGLVGTYLVLWQLVLISRAPWVEHVFGFDKLTRLHHTNGQIALITLLLHPIFITVANLNGGFINTFFDITVNRGDVLKAALGLYMLVGVVVLSISISRKYFKYETWYFVHWLTYVAILLAFAHQLSQGGTFATIPWHAMYWWGLYIAVGVNLAMFRFIRPVWRSIKHDIEVVAVRPETHDVNSIVLKGKDLAGLRVVPGQFAIFRFLAPGFILQAHPFSFSKVVANDEARISVKALGDFTQQLPNVPVGSKVLLDGPYGSFTLRSVSNHKILLIAGGIGITPIHSLAQQAVSEHRDVILIYSASTPDDFALKAELGSLSRSGLQVHYIDSQTSGRLDAAKVQQLVPDFRQRDVFICGPVAMMSVISDGLKVAGLSASRIHFEEFKL